MSSSYLHTLSLLLAAQATLSSAALIDNVPNVEQLGELDGTETKGPNWIQWPLKPGQRFAKKLECVPGFEFAYSGKYVACCMPGQKLVGSFDTIWDCCGEGHDIAGDANAGYQCCPVGQVFDGAACKNPTPPPKPTPQCKNGKTLVDGKCVCPSGQVDGPGDTCVEQGCTSGLTTGKCYTFTDKRGLQYGYSNAGWYSAAEDSRAHIFGKFQLCTTEDCPAGLPVDPNTGISIKDIHGQANSGANAGQWLDNKQNGGHIGKTADFSKAGKFTLTKWPCGKYCLGGVDSGLGPTCPSAEPAFTFNTGDKQACQVVTVDEVPCDIHAPENNCIWKSGDQCCSRVDCSDVTGTAGDFVAPGDGAQAALY